MSYLKPQTPLQHKDGDYFYPLTTIDQVIMEDGLTRLSGADLVSVSTDGAPEGEVVGINADTLGGYAADAYVKKTDAMVVTKNYSVVGGMDEPTIPTENMIWIQTENTIGKVHFSGVEPNNINDNDIWIYTGNSSSVAFDAIKIGDDTMNTVYPLSAKQYVFGAWVDVTAKSYQSGEWVDWYDGELYYNGDEYVYVTGGWGAYAHQYSSAAATASLKPKVEKQSDGSMKITYYPTPATSGAGGGVVRTIGKVDLSKYSKLEFTGYLYSTGGGDYVRLLVWSSMGAYQDTNLVASIDGSSSKTVTTRTLDVSELTGQYYIGFGIYENVAGAEILVKMLKRKE